MLIVSTHACRAASYGSDPPPLLLVVPPPPLPPLPLDALLLGIPPWPALPPLPPSPAPPSPPLPWESAPEHAATPAAKRHRRTREAIFIDMGKLLATAPSVEDDNGRLVWKTTRAAVKPGGRKGQGRGVACRRGAS
ncbi:hypothetical protein E8A74_44115 [Polyangium fumosum]|uniref:Uncharacterized protein n=1 Tax=Polyangium fumosum TaxID=889272 RepID=A0A4U1ISK3_9BACT|nr:hypothetical protein E8A74_44115 [Polyangium fumosum]